MCVWLLVRALVGVKLPAMIRDVCVGARVREIDVIELCKLVDDAVDVDVGNELVDGSVVVDEIGGLKVEDGEDVESVNAGDVVDVATDDESTVVDNIKSLKVLRSDEVVDATSELDDVDVAGMEDDDAAETCWYALRQLPAPQVSVASPRHANEQSAKSVGTLPSLSASPQ
jgi:hypothetical protein